jgi:hypothetical protein
MAKEGVVHDISLNPSKAEGGKAMASNPAVASFGTGCTLTGQGPLVFGLMIACSVPMLH